VTWPTIPFKPHVPRCPKCNKYLPDRCTCNGPSIEERRNAPAPRCMGMDCFCGGDCPDLKKEQPHG
jgi:hypothetical protein